MVLPVDVNKRKEQVQFEPMKGGRSGDFEEEKKRGGRRSKAPVHAPPPLSGFGAADQDDEVKTDGTNSPVISSVPYAGFGCSEPIKVDIGPQIGSSGWVDLSKSNAVKLPTGPVALTELLSNDDPTILS